MRDGRRCERRPAERRGSDEYDHGTLIGCRPSVAAAFDLERPTEAVFGQLKYAVEGNGGFGGPSEFPNQLDHAWQGTFAD